MCPFVCCLCVSPRLFFCVERPISAGGRRDLQNLYLAPHRWTLATLSVCRIRPDKTNKPDLWKGAQKKRLGSQTIEKHKNREAKTLGAVWEIVPKNRVRLSDILSRKVEVCLSRTQQLDLMKSNLQPVILLLVLAFSSHAPL